MGQLQALPCPAPAVAECLVVNPNMPRCPFRKPLCSPATENRNEKPPETNTTQQLVPPTSLARRVSSAHDGLTKRTSRPTTQSIRTGVHLLCLAAPPFKLALTLRRRQPSPSARRELPDDGRCRQRWHVSRSLDGRGRVQANQNVGNGPTLARSAHSGFFAESGYCCDHTERDESAGYNA